MILRKGFSTTLFTLLTLAIAVPAVAQETETKDKVDYKKVIADFIEATGGEAAHKNIKSISATGKISIPSVGLEGDFQMSQLPDKAYTKMAIPGIGDQIVGYDGETAWQVSQMTGPEILEGDRRNQLVRQMSLSPMLEVEDIYDSVECTGIEEFAGEDCYVLVMKAEDSEPVYNYFSVDSKLLMGNKMTTDDPTVGKMVIVTKASDYKDVDGVKMSHVSTVELPQGMQMITKINAYDVNGDVKKDLFDLPEEIQALKEKNEDK